MQEGKKILIKYLVKFVSQRKYADALLSGKLFMRPAAYYHSLELGQGDMREAAIFEGVCIYKNSNWPVYCMYAIDETAIKSGLVEIPGQCIKDFKCESGFAVLLDYALFEPMLSTVNTNGYELDAGKVNYHKLTLKDSEQLLCDKTPRNFFIKHPFFAHQNEYRIVVTKQIYKQGESPVDHIEYSFSSALGKAARIIDVSSLSRQGKNYIFSVEDNDLN